jgi:hypothetical protein
MVELDEESAEVAMAMGPAQLKEMHFRSANLARSRDASGRSLKHR